MAYGLPVKGQANYDDELNNSIEAVKSQAELAQSTADAAQTSAATAATTATNAKATADQALDFVRTTSDDRVAEHVNDTASATSAALSASYAASDSPALTATASATDWLTEGGAAFGKRIASAGTSTGKLVFEVTTEDPNNGYTTINIAPSTDDSRVKLSLWAKSPDSLAAGATNLRPLSLEAHGPAEAGGYDATLYTHIPDGATQNGTVPAFPYGAKVFQWKWGAAYENRFELLFFLHAKGYFNVDTWSTSQEGVVLGINEDAAAGRPATIMLNAAGDSTKRGIIDNRGGVLRFFAGSAGSLEFSGATKFSGGLMDFQGTSTKVRLRAQHVDITSTDGNGIWAGVYDGDAGQPTIWLANGTDAQLAKIDNRNGRMRLIVGSTVPIGIESGKIGFHNTTPVAKQTLAAAATDAATTQALANDIRAKLIALGLMA